MSASLVGSEMCIRDSPGSSACVARAGSRRPMNGSATQLAPCRPRIQKAVSYTHLTLPTICSV
eukprot:8814954-Alexandrium_andersonii.AAC.1